MSPSENEGKTILDDPRYKEKPVLLLFELLVLDTIGQLTDVKRQGVEAMDVKAMLGTEAADWKSAVSESLKLSGTIDVAVLEEWYSAKEKEGDVDAEAFAQAFADGYFADNSQVDVWGEGELEAAKKHIEECKAKGL